MPNFGEQWFYTPFQYMIFATSRVGVKFIYNIHIIYLFVPWDAPPPSISHDQQHCMSCSDLHFSLTLRGAP